LRTFAPTLVHGGHGDCISDFEELFNRYVRAIQQRQAEVIGLLPGTGATAWDVARALFPDTDDVHRFLAVSEAAAHLHLAHSEGNVELESSRPMQVYRKLGAQ